MEKVEEEVSRLFAIFKNDRDDSLAVSIRDFNRCLLAELGFA